MLGWAQPNSARLDNSQPALHFSEHLRLPRQGFNKPQDKRCSCIAWQFQDHNPCVGCGNIIADIRKAEIAGEQTDPVRLRICCNRRIFGTAQANIAHVRGVMPTTFYQCLERTGQVSIN